jgi:TPR repeat protein
MKYNKKMQLSANNTHKKNASTAMYWLSKCYRFGRGVVKDIKKAEDLENKAAREGDEKALGLSRLLQRSQF